MQDFICLPQYIFADMLYIYIYIYIYIEREREREGERKQNQEYSSIINDLIIKQD